MLARRRVAVSRRIYRELGIGFKTGLRAFARSPETARHDLLLLANFHGPLRRRPENPNDSLDVARTIADSSPTIMPALRRACASTCLNLTIGYGNGPLDALEYAARADVPWVSLERSRHNSRFHHSRPCLGGAHGQTVLAAESFRPIRSCAMQTTLPLKRWAMRSALRNRLVTSFGTNLGSIAAPA